MVPLTDPETVVLVRQFRYPLARHFYELPAGKIDSGEEPLQTAKRELREECGYEAVEWRHLATIHPCIGYADERMEFYLARQLNHVGHAPDEDEFLEKVTVGFAEALRWVRVGKITDQKTVIGLLWADRVSREGW
jgi:ADP-ribose pyrophosphatase